MYLPAKSSQYTWGAWKKRVNQWKATAYTWVSNDSTSSSTTSTTGNQMATFANQFYQGTSATSTSAITTGASYTINATTTTSATTSSNVINISAGSATGSITFSDCNVIYGGREITEDEKLQKLVEMEEQLAKMKEALDEALHMNRKLMKNQANERRMAALKKQFSVRVEALQAEADAIVEEAEDILVFSE